VLSGPSCSCDHPCLWWSTVPYGPHLEGRDPASFPGPHDYDYNPRLHDRFNCEDSEGEDSEGEDSEGEDSDGEDSDGEDSEEEE
jgi:hypothetical protein